MDTDEIVSWWSLRHIWREDLPIIRIRAPCNDTCGDCTILLNAFRYRERRQQTSENSDDSDDSDDDKLEDEHGNDNERHAEFKEGEDEVSNLAKSLLTSDCIRQESVLEAVGFHVTQARAMRGMVQYRTQEASESLIVLKRHDTRDRVLVCDYAQNVNYPHYGGEQPGEIYYLSALTINLFDIVDLSVTPNKLNFYAYRESTAKMGSNNVASMLMHNLHEKNWLMKGNPGKRLTISMDNCGGQNKNNHVIRLAAYFIEMKFFLEVEFVFYVRGHTKNTCNRMFNQMKLRFHKQDIFTYKQAFDALGKQDSVTMIDAI
jgi:hypothetical protein